MSVATTWGTTADERRIAFPCDRLLGQPDLAYYRGITIRAKPGTIFRWLCQLRIAPYSYDLLDNLGRGSPQELTPGLDELAAGQRLMGVFELVDFERERHLTIQLRCDTFESRVYGLFVSDLAASYLVAQEASADPRLLLKMVVRYRRGPLGWVARVVLPWGDLIMMRKQFLNLKRLAEQTPKNG